MRAARRSVWTKRPTSCSRKVRRGLPICDDCRALTGAFAQKRVLAEIDRSQMRSGLLTLEQTALSGRGTLVDGWLFRQKLNRREICGVSKIVGVGLFEFPKRISLYQYRLAFSALKLFFCFGKKPLRTIGRQKAGRGIFPALPKGPISDRGRELAQSAVGQHRIHHEATARPDRGWPEP